MTNEEGGHPERYGLHICQVLYLEAWCNAWSAVQQWRLQAAEGTQRHFTPVSRFDAVQDRYQCWLYARGYAANRKPSQRKRDNPFRNKSTKNKFNTGSKHGKNNGEIDEVCEQLNSPSVQLLVCAPTCQWVACVYLSMLCHMTSWSLVIIAWCKGLSQASTWTNMHLLSVGRRMTFCNKIIFEIHTVLFGKCISKCRKK